LREISLVEAEREFVSCQVPSLYIAGTADRLVGAGVARELKTPRPDIVVRTINAPHLVLQKRPEEAAAIIATFLTAHTAP
jgi:pimeloyl-ACP methyl ester carboxylesterase